MKKMLFSLFVASLLLVAVVAFADKNLPVYKKGDTVYVCTCGDSCDCKTMANKEGKCSCGVDLGKGTVSSVSKDKVVVKVGDKSLNFLRLRRRLQLRYYQPESGQVRLWQ